MDEQTRTNMAALNDAMGRLKSVRENQAVFLGLLASNLAQNAPTEVFGDCIAECMEKTLDIAASADGIVSALELMQRQARNAENN